MHASSPFGDVAHATEADILQRCVGDTQAQLRCNTVGWRLPRLALTMRSMTYVNVSFEDHCRAKGSALGAALQTLGRQSLDAVYYESPTSRMVKADGDLHDLRRPPKQSGQIQGGRKT